jgi:hypothetical protein
MYKSSVSISFAKQIMPISRSLCDNGTLVTWTVISLTTAKLSLLYFSTLRLSLSWNKAPVWGLRPDFYYCQTVAGLLMWGALSDQRTGLSFTIAPGPCQCSPFRVRLPWYSWPYFTVSDSRLPFSSPPTARRVTVEVFDPASTREFSTLMNELSFVARGEQTRDHHLQQFVYCSVLSVAMGMHIWRAVG